jgi:beta-glucanase (GH16 family)
VRKQLAAGLVALTVIQGSVLAGCDSAGTSSANSASGSARASSSSSLAGMDTGWKLTFNPGFPGSSLNTAVSATCYPWAQAVSGCTNFGNSDEYEWYLPSQDQVSHGILHLVAQPVPTRGMNRDGRPKEYFCRSGMVTTYPSFRFTFGYVQVIARIPLATGLWTAFWLAAANQQWPPEIDILEHWGVHNDNTAVYFHPVGAKRIGAHPVIGNLSVGWHTFALYWTRTRLIWFIDGRAVMSTDQHVPQQPMYFIANLANTSPPGHAGCAGTLLIRSVKVWQP